MKIFLIGLVGAVLTFVLLFLLSFQFRDLFQEISAIVLGLVASANIFFLLIGMAMIGAIFLGIRRSSRDSLMIGSTIYLFILLLEAFLIMLGNEILVMAGCVLVLLALFMLWGSSFSSFKDQIYTSFFATNTFMLLLLILGGGVFLFEYFVIGSQGVGSCPICPEYLSVFMLPILLLAQIFFLVLSLVIYCFRIPSES